MTDDNKPIPTQHFIPCTRYSSTRCALCCVIFDRYKVCRRHCKELKNHLSKHPDLTEKAIRQIEERKTENINKANLFDMANVGKYAGKNLPDEILGCRVCSFIAKSPRGLKIHMRRSHKLKLDLTLEL